MKPNRAFFSAAIASAGLALFSGCSPVVSPSTPIAPTDGAQWNGVALDSTSIYAVGSIDGFDRVTLSANVEAAGTNSQTTAVMARFDSDGQPLWVRTQTGTGWSQFAAVAADSSGVYAVGLSGGDVTWGPGIETSSPQAQAVIVKYDQTGMALWARSPAATTARSRFTAVAVSADGRVYAGGSYRAPLAATNPMLDFGGDVELSEKSQSGNVLLVQYDAAGTALWARTQTSEGDNPNSPFGYLALAANSDVVYAAGTIDGQTQADFGLGVSVHGNGNFYGNAVLVKYSSAGDAQWARTQTSGANSADYLAVAADASGVYVAGEKYDTSIGFGGGVSLPGTGGGNVSIFMVVKYDAAGQAVWARQPSANHGSSALHGIAFDSDGVYAAGWTASDTVDLGGASIGGLSTPQQPGNLLLVRYSADGAPLSVSSASGRPASYYRALAIKGSRRLAAGAAIGMGTIQPAGTVVNQAEGSPKQPLLVSY